MSDPEQLQKLWDTIRERLKAAELNPPLYRALDAAVPVTLDGTTLVVGFDTEHEPDMHFLNTPTIQPLLQRVLSGVATKPLQLLTIDGTTVEAYEHFRERQRVAEQLRQGQRQETARVEKPEEQFEWSSDWAHRADTSLQLVSELAHEIHTRMRTTPHSRQWQVRAKVLMSSLPELFVLADRLAEIERDPLQRARQFSRAIEAYAETFGADPAVVAIEYERLRRQREGA